MASAKGYAMQREKTPRRNIVRLADLAPQRDIKGGAGRVVFGADGLDSPKPAGETDSRAGMKNVKDQEDAMAGSKKAKDLAPKKSGSVKGGRMGNTNQHNFTLVRAAKPSVKKDLSPTKNPKGGKKAS